jgi:hypothetical protein
VVCGAAGESGEDHLYHKEHFVLVDFPKVVKNKILAFATATYVKFWPYKHGQVA